MFPRSNPVYYVNKWMFADTTHSLKHRPSCDRLSFANQYIATITILLHKNEKQFPLPLTMKDSYFLIQTSSSKEVQDSLFPNKDASTSLSFSCGRGTGYYVPTKERQNRLNNTFSYVLTETVSLLDLERSQAPYSSVRDGRVFAHTSMAVAMVTLSANRFTRLLYSSVLCTKWKETEKSYSLHVSSPKVIKFRMGGGGQPH